MKWLFPVLMFVFYFSAQAQDLINANDYKGLKDGHYTESYKNGTPWLHYKIKGGVLDSTFTMYFSSGQPVLVYHFSKGRYIDSITQFKNNGKPVFIQHINKDKMIDEHTYSYYKSGELKKHIIWQRANDTLINSLDADDTRVLKDFWDCTGCLSNSNGTVTKYYKDGKILKTGRRVDQHRYGKWVWYKPNGKVKRSKEYKLKAEKN